MKVGERGQVTIPKEMRERFGIQPGTPIEFEDVHGRLVLRKASRKLNLSKWRGACAKVFEDLGNPSVDETLENLRGR